ncbi:MAG: hypothetical protein AABZ44_02975 [Elusimicrobiota bacterium]
MSEAKESEFKGNPVLVLTDGPDEKYPFSFGLRKARLIVEQYEKIKEFVAKHQGEAK